MADERNEKSLIERLRDGEKILCMKCGKDYYRTSAKDISTSHGFSCDACGAMINIDPVIDIE